MKKEKMVEIDTVTAFSEVFTEITMPVFARRH